MMPCIHKFNLETTIPDENQIICIKYNHQRMAIHHANIDIKLASYTTLDSKKGINITKLKVPNQFHKWNFYFCIHIS